MPVKTLKIENEYYSNMGPSYEYMDIVNDLKKQGYTLSPVGLQRDTKEEKTPFTEAHINERLLTFKKCEALIPFIVRKNKKQHLIGSYGFKHVIECIITENYISNGEAILMMLKLGYGLQHRGGSDPNVDFSCTYSNSDIVQLLAHDRTKAKCQKF